MRYSESRPPEALCPWVAACWQFEVPAEVAALPHAIPLTGGAILGLNLQGGPLMLFGPRTAPLQTVVRGGDRFAGLHLWPGVHRDWLGGTPGVLRESVRPLAELAEAGWVAALERALRAAAQSGWVPAEGRPLVDHFLAHHPRLRDEAVMSAVLRILCTAGREPVGDLPRSVGLAPATFRRRFKALVELSPKELARIRRVRASAADAVAGGRWAGIAADRGFADQAHLVREFQELLGRSPEGFRAHGTRIQHHLLDP